MTENIQTAPKAKPERPFASLIFGFVLPIFILTKFGSNEEVGPINIFIISLAIPLLYGVWDYHQRKKISFMAGLGFVSILIKGSLGLMKLDIFWFAVNEAALPGLIGLAILITGFTKKPLVKVFLLNDSIMHIDQVNSALEEKQKETEFATLLRESTYLLFFAFLISAVLNFVLAIYMLKSEPGTGAFNVELGKMQFVSVPVLMVCSSSVMIFALWRLIKKLQVLTGLELEGILKIK